MEGGKSSKMRRGPFFFFFKDDKNLFWVYQNGNFLPGKRNSCREKKIRKMTAPSEKNSCYAHVIENGSDDITSHLLHFRVLDTMYQWSMMKNIHSPNLVGIGSWGPEIWPHEYLISPIEISVNWPDSKQL